MAELFQAERKVFRLLKSFENKVDSAVDAERIHVEQDFRELLNNLGAYPHSTRVWALEYRDQDIS